MTLSAGITRVSVSSDGSEANRSSYEPNISADGRYVTFRSSASSLDAEDTNTYYDIFVHDRQTGETSRVSVATDGSEANAFSYGSSLSADGRYVTFQSYASNLVAGDTNAVPDIFVHDLQTGEISRVSVATDGSEANHHSFGPSLSADGRYVTFRSHASNLVTGDTNFDADIFVHDRQTGETSRVSVATDGSEASDASYAPSLSADGRYVTFQSYASNLVAGDTNAVPDIFVHDLQTGETSRVNVATDGSEANDTSYAPSLSANGRYVTFSSDASNLVAGDTNGAPDIFVHDRQTGETSRVSVAADGSEANGGSNDPNLSADGRYVTFQSYASNLVAGDTNRDDDIFVHDRLTGETSRVSVAADGSEANGASYEPSLSADGSYVTFRSVASNLVAGDTNNSGDIFTVANPLFDSSNLPVAPSDLVLEYMARIVAYGGNTEGYFAGDELLDIDGDPIGYTIDQVFTTTSGFLAVAALSENREPILSIRGSEELVLDWLLADTNPDGIGVLQFEDAWAQTGAGSLREWITENQADGIHLVGHSLGGAQAQLVAAAATEVGFEIASLTTYNSPGISDDWLARTEAILLGEVEHRISAGDVVSMAGDGFIDGEVTIYNNQTIFGDDIPSYLAHFALAHGSNWSQSSLYGSAYDINHLTDRSDSSAPAGPILSTVLSDDSYSHATSNGFYDYDYVLLVYGLSRVIERTAPGINLLFQRDVVTFGGEEVAVALSSRENVEALRQDVGSSIRTGIRDVVNGFNDTSPASGTLADDLRELTLDAGSAVLAFGNAIAGWGVDTVGGVFDWGAHTWDALLNWGNDTLSGLVDWSVETVVGFADWSIGTIAGTTLWNADALAGLAHWAGDTWTAVANWTDESLQGIGTWSQNTFAALDNWDEVSLRAIGAWNQDTFASIANWSAESLNGLGRWGADTWAATASWGADSVAALGHWGGDTWTASASWGARTWSGISDWSVDSITELAGYSVETIEDIANWSVDQYERVAEFGIAFVSASIEALEAVGERAIDAGQATHDSIFNLGGSLHRLLHPSYPTVEEIEAILGVPEARAGSGTFQGADVREDIQMSLSDDDVAPGGGFDVITFGAGADTARGTAAELDGDRFRDFTVQDRLVFESTGTFSGSIGVTYGSALLDIDFDGDGVVDSTVYLEGDFEGAQFVAEMEDGATVIRVMGASNGIIEGGTDGDDRVLGSPGDDLISGGDGNDTLVGGEGDDILTGGTSVDDRRDVIYGGAGDDHIDGGYGNDELRGDAGNDRIAGGFGADTVIGGTGDDVMTGSAFSDLLFGGDGMDFVNGGFGHDRVNGGAGADRFFHIGIRDHGSDWIQDFNAAEGDTLLFGIGTATGADFRVTFAHTASATGERAGDDAVQEAFVIYSPTGQVMWALVDGAAQAEINIVIGGVAYDLLA